MSRIARGWAVALGIVLIGPSSGSTAARPDPSAQSEKPDPASVERYGPAYRYPRAGWIVLHIEGGPYERGYQHGRLLAPEIADYIKALANHRSPKAPADAWRANRRLIDALFLRRYDKEFLEEMKGIADGATAAGAKFDDRALDLLDLVAVNSEIEVDFLDGALQATPTGLEGRRFVEPTDASPRPDPPEHCSAFAATGPATADGTIVFGHITMFHLYLVRHFNVWLDIKPERGHRMAMQTYPGGIQSGMDYYQNDAGLLVAETTIAQTHFNIDGMSISSRIRKVVQYADSIDKAVEILTTSNNGMYTNEWLLGDTKTNEIAMFELGTNRSKLWRSSKDEWLGGTKGFYWGCNNTKDLGVRLETLPSLEGKPANVVFHPTDRDRAWIRLYEKHKGKIGESFGFEAFTTPPIAGSPSSDAKFTTSALAKDLKTWALFGPPMGRTWEPTDAERVKYADIRPHVPNDWALLGTERPATSERPQDLATGVDKALDQDTTIEQQRALTAAKKAQVASLRLIAQANDPALIAAENQLEDNLKKLTSLRTERRTVIARRLGITLNDPASVPVAVDLGSSKRKKDPGKDDEDDDKALGLPATLPAAWHGTILPESDADVWLAAAFADYERIVAQERAIRSRAKDRALKPEERDRLDLALFAPRSKYLSAVQRSHEDIPLSEIRSSLTDDAWYQIASGKGVLFLAQLRATLGDDAFLKLMDDFGRAHAGKPTSTEDFHKAIAALTFLPSKPFAFDAWLKDRGLPDDPGGGFWSIDTFEAEPDKTLIVYGTLKESDAQREAAELLQRLIARRWSNVMIPIVADVDASDLKDRHVLLVGRPDSNRVAAQMSRAFPVSFGPASFVVRGETYAHPASAVIAAASNPLDPHREVVLFAGLSGEATRRVVMKLGDRDRNGQPAEVLLLPSGARARRLVIPPTLSTKSADRARGGRGDDFNFVIGLFY